MRKNLISLLFILVLGAGMARGQGLWGGDLGAIAQQVQKSYEATQALRMDFVQETYVEVLEQKVNKRGQAQFKKPGKFWIRYEGSPARRYQSDGKKLWIYQEGESQVQTLKVDEGTVPSEALSFLGGFGQLTQDFAVEEVDSQKWKSLQAEKGSLQWMELTPLRKRSAIQWLVVGFDPQTHLAAEIYFLTDTGNLSHYRFSSVLANGEIGDEIFEFREKGVKAVTP